MIGSLCSGYGGLELGLLAALGAPLDAVAWHADPDPAAAAILARHWPGVPNLGDITTIDWATVEPVEWLTAGYPCQPFSRAGRRKGTADERHLWPHVAEAVRRVRPRRVLLENVAGHRSLGFGDVLADLAALGYDARWTSLRAADVGAPHLRERVFVLAADTGGEAGRLGTGPRPSGPGGIGWGRPDHDPASASADAESDGRHERWPEPARLSRRPDVALSGDPASADADRDAVRQQPVSERGRGSAPIAGQSRADTPTDADESGLEGRRGTELRRPGQRAARTSGVVAAADPGHSRRARGAPQPVGGPVGGAAAAGDSGVDWREYGPAITRWCRILGRPAPAPTVRGSRGGHRLSPAFDEWLMGLPEGWVTGTPGLSRNAQLRAIGNGVVPQQAAAALRLILPSAA